VSKDIENGCKLTFGHGTRKLTVIINDSIGYEKIKSGESAGLESGIVTDGIHLIELIGWACYVR
jgi:hypothetical protein